VERVVSGTRPTHCSIFRQHCAQLRGPDLSTTRDSTDWGIVRSVCIVLFWYLAAFSYAHAQEFPVANGFTWEQVRFPSAFEEMEESNLIVEGAVEQGVDWFSLGDRLVSTLFGSLPTMPIPLSWILTMKSSRRSASSSHSCLPTGRNRGRCQVRMGIQMDN